MEHKPGVICLITGCSTKDGFDKYVGKSVELVAAVGKDYPLLFKNYNWHPDVNGCWIVTGNIGKNGNKAYTMLQERFLLPIHDPDQVPIFDISGLILTIDGREVEGFEDEDDDNFEDEGDKDAN